MIPNAVHPGARGQSRGKPSLASPEEPVTPYAPISTPRVIEAIEAGGPERRTRLREVWPELADALAELLRANAREVPGQWRERRGPTR